MKKYRVLKKYPKQIMNGSRMVTLMPKAVVYLKYEAQLERLIQLGYIKEIHEIGRKKVEKTENKSKETKTLVKPQKPKAKYQQDTSLADKTGE